MLNFNLWVNSFYENLDPFYFNYFTGTILLVFLIVSLAFFALLAIMLVVLLSDMLIEKLIKNYPKFKKACCCRFRQWLADK